MISYKLLFIWATEKLWTFFTQLLQNVKHGDRLKHNIDMGDVKLVEGHKSHPLGRAHDNYNSPTIGGGEQHGQPLVNCSLRVICDQLPECLTAMERVRMACVDWLLTGTKVSIKMAHWTGKCKVYHRIQIQRYLESTEPITTYRLNTPMLLAGLHTTSALF